MNDNLDPAANLRKKPIVLNCKVVDWENKVQKNGEAKTTLELVDLSSGRLIEIKNIITPEPSEDFFKFAFSYQDKKNIKLTVEFEN